STITLTLDISQNITNVTGVLFNGQNFDESYTVTALSAGPPVSQNFSLSGDLTSSASVATFNLSSATAITEVDITTPNSEVNGWDFLVDSIVATSGPAIPEPSSIVMGGTSLIFVGLVYAWRRWRHAAA